MLHTLTPPDTDKELVDVWIYNFCKEPIVAQNADNNFDLTIARVYQKREFTASALFKITYPCTKDLKLFSQIAYDRQGTMQAGRGS